MTVTHPELPSGIRSITEWVPGRQPVQMSLDAARTSGAVIWIDVAQDAEPEAACGVLLERCTGLSEEIFAELIEPDPQPSRRTWADGQIRSVSSFVVQAEEPDENAMTAQKVGSLRFQPVEFVAGEGWLLSCWQPAHRSKSPVSGDVYSYAETLANVRRRWPELEVSSAGDLAIVILRQLARGYPRVRRRLHAWFDVWERDLYREPDQADRSAPIALRGLIAEFRNRLNALNVPMTDAQTAWFTGVTNVDEAEGVDDLIDRSLVDLRELSDALRGGLDLLTAQAVAEQLRQGDRLQNLVAVITSVLLVPTLVATVFGANTDLPWKDQSGGLDLMLALMVFFGVVSYLLIRWAIRHERQKTKR